MPMWQTHQGDGAELHSDSGGFDGLLQGKTMAFLQAETGPKAGGRIELSLDRMVLGRHPDCNIQLEVSAVSRQHAALSKDRGDWYVEDLNSRNGTYVNDAPVQGKAKLFDGDRIRICDVVLVFRAAPTTTSQTPSTTPMQQVTPDGSVFGAVFADDENSEAGGGTIMSRLDLSLRKTGSMFTTSPEVRLAALMEIMSSLGRALKLDDVLSSILTSLFKIFPQADRGFVVLRDPDGKLIPRWVKTRRESQEDSLRISRTIIRTVMESKEAILSADAASDQRFEMSQSITDFRIRSMMCAPLLNSDGEAIGALQIDTLDQRKKFQAEDLELLASTAGQAAIAIQNAQLHDTALKQAEVERDMQLAREVQRGFLPNKRPTIEGYEFFDYYQPADQVGGDYFDYLELGDGRVAVIVADVVGHGVAAALLMAKLSAEARYSLFQEKQPSKAVTLLNERLCALDIGRFITFILVIIDPQANTATMVNAGHMSPIVLRKKGGIEEPAEEIGGLPLGISDALPYEELTIQVEPGDMLTLYTDGINECIGPAGDFYTIERLREKIIANAASGAAAATGPILVDDVRTFLGRAPQPDDMCLVCVSRA